MAGTVADDDLVAGAVHKPCGYGQWILTALRTLDSSGDLTANTKRLSTCKGRPIRALIQANVQAIRWTDDPDPASLDPTVALGQIIPAGTVLEYDGDLSKFRMIAAAAGAIADVMFYSI